MSTAATEEKKADDSFAYSGSEESDDDDAVEIDVTQRLRDKIRSQAADLLSRVDSVREAPISTPRNSNGDTATTTTNCDEVEGSPQIAVNGNGDNLTKRLQRLATKRNALTRDQELRIIQSNSNSHLAAAKTFDELNLPNHLLQAVYAMGFDRPSVIQEAALPRILAGRNVMGQAQSGSGKTAAFCLGMLNGLDLARDETQAICVTPTRELAIQIVEQALLPMARNMPELSVQLAISQVKKARTVPHIVVGTPGKVVDWLKRKLLQTHSIRVFVLDEADNMVDGHKANSLKLASFMPESTQFLFFSATFPEDTLQFARKLMNGEADQILLADRSSLVLDVIKQVSIDCRKTNSTSKLEFLADMYELLTIAQSIVFCNTKQQADTVHKTLTASGYTCSILHSAVDLTERDATMAAFRNHQTNVLIATNLLARGVDVDQVCLVVNYGLPITKDEHADCETYLHRIGRTGRFGRKGTAVNLVDSDADLQLLQEIELHFGCRITACEPDPESLATEMEI